MAKKAQPKKASASSTSASAIPLSQPDRSGPSDKTLFQIASERGLLDSSTHHTKSGAPPKNAVPIRKPVADEDISRLGNSILWSTSMAMLHFTFDVLTSHQYAETIIWADLIIRAFQAFLIIIVLFYTLHPFPSPPLLMPTLTPLLVQTIFFLMSVSAGCYLITITNEYSYYHVLKQAPPLGVLWIWATIELDLSWALWSVGLCVVWLKSNGYSVTGSV